MNEYRYVHRDGRIGEGTSSYRAIVAAIGPDEENAIGETYDPQWQWVNDAEYVPAVAGQLSDDDWTRYGKSDLVQRSTDNVVGTLFRR